MNKIKLNKSGVRELLKSSELSNECQRYASNTLSRCGDGYEMQARNYPNRSGYAVVAKSYKAYKDNSKNNTLLKAVGK